MDELLKAIEKALNESTISLHNKRKVLLKALVPITKQWMLERESERVEKV